MNEPKPYPLTGWEQINPLVENASKDYEYLTCDARFPGFRIAHSEVMERHNKGCTIYRRRIPAPADGWLDFQTVKPTPGIRIWVGSPGATNVVLWEQDMYKDGFHGCWTHWQPAVVPAPPKAPEPVKSKEEVGFGKWINASGLAGSSYDAYEAVWFAALAWRKAHP